MLNTADEIKPYKPKSRSISIDKLLKTKFKTMDFEDKWFDSFGKPEANGAWLVWGQSYNGKTRFCLQLAKYMTRFGIVLYNTLEEGARLSMQEAIEDMGMKLVARKFQLKNRMPLSELKVELKKRKSASIIFIDSFQYLGLSKKEYIRLKEEFPNKLFVFVSHAEGKMPEGKVAKFVKYDVDCKIHIEGYRASVQSRYKKSGKPLIISQELYDEYWGERVLKSIEKVNEK